MYGPRKLRATPLVAAVAVATVLFGLPSPTHAATTGTAKPAKTNVVSLCGTAKKGEAACFALRRADLGAGKGVKALAAVAGYGPADLRTAYQLPDSGGAGQTIAIVDAFDDPNAEADLGVYRQQYGLPPCTSTDGCFRKVDQRGGTAYPRTDSGWAGEISLDLDMVSAIAPQAHILLVEADTPAFLNLAAGVDTAVSLGAKFVSNSYGSGYDSTPGSGEDPSETTDLDPHYNHPGVVMVASSGDSDFGVSYPAASSYVTAVGGTSLNRDPNTGAFTETVWHNSHGGPGSGCSVFETKPAFQQDTGCANRTVADVSAVADPVTGVAVYDTFGEPGWSVFGGTSAASPIIAGVYALAGSPVAGSYPNAYPYAHTDALHDVTTGANGTCTPDYLCTAGPGYDGPTGLGTPKGTDAFAAGPHADLAGTVTDSSTGAAIAGAKVTAGEGTAITDAQGHYALSLSAGTYDVTASVYGYNSVTLAGVTLADGDRVTQNFALQPVPRATVSGTVRDGSGHGWPLYAKLTVDGLPGGPVFTDPHTGGYSLRVPQGATYQVQITANYPGYQAVTATVPVGTSDVAQDFSVPVDAKACNAPGYALHFSGPTQTFDATTPPAGWSVQNANDNGGWVFDDPGSRGNQTGGTGGFAIIDSDEIGQDLSEDTVLSSPSADLTSASRPVLSFDTDYHAFQNSTADVDLSVDGGQTWSNVWHQDTEQFRGPAHVDIAIPEASGHDSVMARFHYTGTWAWWWELDNVFLGDRTCDPVTGGLVAGVVTDANTKAGLAGAQVSSVDAPNERGLGAGTPDDPNLGDGFYWMFSSLTGSHAFTATKHGYASLTATKNVAANTVTVADFALAAGRITVTPGAIAATVPWAGQATSKVTLKNTGTAPASVRVNESVGGFQPLISTGAPLHLVPGKYSTHARAKGTATTQGTAPAANPAEEPWTSIADYPTPITHNLAVADGGLVYSAFGYDGNDDVSKLYVYDPDTGGWTARASAADTREKPAGGFLRGKLYVTDGWGFDGDPDGKLEIYDPAANTWSIGAPDPKPYAAPGFATLGGKLYVIGGCTPGTCGYTDVLAYDPASNAWAQVAPYPEATSWASCGAIATRVYCAGGANDSNSGTTHGYSYDPVSNRWSPIADLPIDLWGGGFVAANGRLLVSGGVTASSSALTNQGYAYDPGTDSWSALPNANNVLFGGASACGFYRIGGLPDGGLFTPPVPWSEVLPGFGDCTAVSDVDWLSESPASLTLQPGASATVTVTFDASGASITQPGTYTASLPITSDTPYPVSQVDASMVVKPAKTWGKITGTVATATGTPIAGATVQINTWVSSYTLKTDSTGHYQLWLDVRNNPLQLIVAKDGYVPQVKTVKIRRGETTTLDFGLKTAP